MITFDLLYCGGYQYLLSPNKTYGEDVLCDCDSAGGVSVYCKFRNLSDKTIKYVKFLRVTPRNSVDDPVSCTVTGCSTTSLTITGPIAPDAVTGKYTFENVWYNPTIKGLIIGDIEIIYMDGTSEIVKYTRTDKEIIDKENRDPYTWFAILSIAFCIIVFAFIFFDIFFDIF